MRKPPQATVSSDRIAQMASRGEDVSVHFTNEFRVVRPTCRVTVDLTPGLVRQLDQMAARLGISRRDVVSALLEDALANCRTSGEIREVSPAAPNHRG